MSETEALRDLLKLVKDDSHALCFQTFSQYRQVIAGEILRKIRALTQVSEDDPELHWYCFTFMAGDRTSTRCYGFLGGYINGERLMQARDAMPMPDGAVVLNISFLGVMTRTAFEGSQNEQG